MSDVVSLDDEVWVKVMDVQVESFEDDITGRTRQRHKVKLSMKYVHQDTGQDLDVDNEQLEDDMQRNSNRGGGGGSGGSGRGMNVGDGTNGANSQLGRALASNIGMSSAIDPGNLILKGKRSGGGVDNAAMSSFNGYALVGEDEGETEPITTTTMKSDYSGKNVKPVPPAAVVRPMGRGRGSTLPAWMTRSDPVDDRLGSMSGVPGIINGKEPTGENNTGHSDNPKSRKHDKRHRKEGHRKHSRSDTRKHRRRHKDGKRGDRHRRGGDRRRSRSRSLSSYSTSSSVESQSRSRSPEERRRHSRSKSHRRKKSHKQHRRRDFSRSRSRSRDGDGGGDGASPVARQSSASSEFSNVEEARAIMERLARRRGER